MRIFWHNGALQLLPEDRRESELLDELSRNVKFGRPPELNGPPNMGESSSGEDVFDRIVGNHRLAPSGLSRKGSNKDTVVTIHKLR